MWLRSDCVIEEHYGRCLVAKSKCALPLRSRRIRSRLNCIDAGSVKRLSRHKPLVACRQAPALFIPRPLDLGIKSAGDKLSLSLIRHPLFDKRGWSRDQVGVQFAAVFTAGYKLFNCSGKTGFGRCFGSLGSARRALLFRGHMCHSSMAAKGRHCTR